MKITDIKKDDFVKICANSWTVKDNTMLKTKGVIKNIKPIMKLPPREVFTIHKTLKENGIEKYCGNLYTDGEHLYYPHHFNDFYEQQIKRFGKPLCEEEYKRHLEYEKAVDDLRDISVLTVIDCKIIF